MTRPLEAMLAKWPVVYPVSMDAGERDNERPGGAERIREEIVALLQDGGDIHLAFEAKLAASRDGGNPCHGGGNDIRTVIT